MIYFSGYGEFGKLLSFFNSRVQVLIIEVSGPEKKSATLPSSYRARAKRKMYPVFGVSPVTVLRYRLGSVWSWGTVITSYVLQDTSEDSLYSRLYWATGGSPTSKLVSHLRQETLIVVYEVDVMFGGVEKTGSPIK